MGWYLNGAKRKTDDNSKKNQRRKEQSRAEQSRAEIETELHGYQNLRLQQIFLGFEHLLSVHNLQSASEFDENIERER